MKTRRYARFALLALAVLLVAWLLPSVFSAERYRHRLASYLEQVLGRPVKFGTISLKLIPRPGFSIDNATVLEDPAFGSEPFARVDHIDCDLNVLNLLRGRISLARLRLQGAAINLVRNASGRWNVERFEASPGPPLPGSPTAAGLAIQVEDGHLDFKIGADKKPFAVTDVSGRLSLDRRRRAVDFDLTGSPVRTDIGLPSPGAIQFQGKWAPGPEGEGALNATLRTRGALLYDWIPLVAGGNPGIYGMMDAEAQVTGSVSLLSVEAQAKLTQVRRWESLPPSGDLPLSLSLKVRFDRRAAKASIEQLEAVFGGSQLGLTGTIVQLGSNPVLDLSAAITHSRLEDLATLAGRVAGHPLSLAYLGPVGLLGSVNGIIAVQGAWSEPSFSGSVSASGARLVVGGASLPVSDANLRLDGREIDLLPLTISATPRLAVVAEGVLRLRDSVVPRAFPRARRAAKSGPGPARPPGYQLTLSAHSVPAHEVVSFARDLGLSRARALDAQGALTVDLTLTGTLWPPARPALSGLAELDSGLLWVPGLVQPLEISEARISLDGDRLSIDPLTASFAGSALTGRLSHAGARSEPWTFEARASAVDLTQVLPEFEAFGHPAEPTWFERIPGLSTLDARRLAGTGLFNALHAEGEFSTPVLAYRGVTLRDFRGRAEISHRLLRLTSASFRISSGRGRSSADIDLSGPVPHLSAQFDLTGLRVENWTSHLPPQLADLRGAAAFSGRFVTAGTSRAQLETSLEGTARLRLTNLDLGSFDPLR
ncbi:MAG TPA: AsmA family protein, partial [Terriglobia bacterium]